MNEPRHKRVGYDYVATVRDLLTRMTYEDLAFAVGYESVGSLSGILRGQVPGHIYGEAIWDLYVDTFSRKPPLRFGASVNEASSV